MRKTAFLGLASCYCLSIFCSEEAIPSQGFFFFADPLYWQAHGDGLSYVLQSSSQDHLRSAKAKNPSFDWDFGFQVGFGYHTPWDGWSASLGLKHIHTNAHGSSSAKEGEFLFPLWGMQGMESPAYADQADVHWRLHLGLLDAILEKKWEISSALDLTPFIGLRSAWIRQKYNLFYLGGSLAPNREEQFSMKNKFWGLGPEIGIKTSWKIGKGWSLFAEFLAAILYGEFYIHQAEWFLGSDDKPLGIHEVFDSSVPTIDTTAGICWEHTWKGSLKRFSVKLAWDQIILPEQNQFLRFCNTQALGSIVTNQGDLSLQGYRLGLHFDF